MCKQVIGYASPSINFNTTLTFSYMLLKFIYVEYFNK